MKLDEVGKSNSSEPILSATAAVVVPAGIIYTILSFVFPKIPQDVLNAFAAFIAFLLPWLIALIARRTAWSPKSVIELVNEVRNQTTDDVLDRAEKARKQAIEIKQIKTETNQELNKDWPNP